MTFTGHCNATTPFTVNISLPQYYPELLGIVLVSSNHQSRSIYATAFCLLFV